MNQQFFFLKEAQCAVAQNIQVAFYFALLSDGALGYRFEFQSRLKNLPSLLYWNESFGSKVVSDKTSFIVSVIYRYLTKNDKG